ncbi:hypothetical protein FNV43_RR21319 [Rhamnella rubrinervis]|uniref:LysM domain-containing protein n=1 Tax=Rhamnella rubrinervis TaxID=2594499 RepID=A0A8K0E1G5_9ROSA|nr:hypothetical protein FNV43_RR21319 [Rhamnella rubrinervis]
MIRNPQQLLLLLFLLPLIHTTHAKFIIEACSSSDSCTSLLSYLLPWDSKLSEIAFRFQLNVTDLMATNSINLTEAYSGNQIFAERTRLKIPIQCYCVDGIRRSVSTTYTVRPADSLESISEGFGGLVSVDQIRIVNDINGKKNQLRSGESIAIPLPCTCFGNSNNGVSTVFMSYVVQREESLSSIGMEFGTTVNELVTVNGLGQPVVDPGDILAIPIPGSNLFIGDFYTNQTTPGYCNVTRCIYRGHSGGQIFRSIVNTSAHVQCSGMKDYSCLPPAVSLPPCSVPFAALPPASSPIGHDHIGAISPISSKPPMTSSSSITYGGYYNLFLSEFYLFIIFLL